MGTPPTDKDLELLVKLFENSALFKPNFGKTPAPTLSQADIYADIDKYPVLLQNAIYCKTCDTILVSRHRHDFVRCACGNGVDGGLDYLKSMGTFENMVSMSLSTDSPQEDVINNLVWGVRGKSGEPDMEPVVTYRRLSELETDHLQAILKTQTHISQLYKDTIAAILTARQNEASGNE